MPDLFAFDSPLPTKTSIFIFLDGRLGFLLDPLLLPGFALSPVDPNPSSPIVSANTVLPAGIVGVGVGVGVTVLVGVGVAVTPGGVVGVGFTLGVGVRVGFVPLTVKFLGPARVVVAKTRAEE